MVFLDWSQRAQQPAKCQILGYREKEERNAAIPTPKIMTSVSFQCCGEDGKGLYPSARSHLGPREAPRTCLGCGSSSSSLGASPCIVQNPSIFLVCPKGTPSADCLSESWTPPGIGVALRHLSVSRRGLWVPSSPQLGAASGKARCFPPSGMSHLLLLSGNAVDHLHLGQKGHFLDVSGLLSLSITLLCAKGTWYGDKWHQ